MKPRSGSLCLEAHQELLTRTTSWTLWYVSVYYWCTSFSSIDFISIVGREHVHAQGQDVVWHLKCSCWSKAVPSSYSMPPFLKLFRWAKAWWTSRLIHPSNRQSATSCTRPSLPSSATTMRSFMSSTPRLSPTSMLLALTVFLWLSLTASIHKHSSTRAQCLRYTPKWSLTPSGCSYKPFWQPIMRTSRGMWEPAVAPSPR